MGRLFSFVLRLKLFDIGPTRNMISPYKDEQAWENQYLMMASKLKL